MKKYIDAEKLIAEIERLKSVLTDPLCSQGNILGPDWVAGGNKMLNEISSVIDSLQQEQPEVDLEKFDKELTKMWGRCAAEPNDTIACLHIDSFIEVARHFYKLGKNLK